MSKNLHFYEIVAGADNSRAMEADTIQKNGASPKSLMSKGSWRLLTLFILLTSIFVFSSCKKDEKTKTNNNTELPKYIAIDENLGDQIDFAILGLDGYGYFYEFQDENPNIPKRFLLSDRNNLDLVVNFDEKGLPKSILSENTTIVLGNYEGKRFDAVVITKWGESQLFENIETDIDWDEYVNDIISGELSQAASQTIVLKSLNSILNKVTKWVSPAVSAVSCAFFNVISCISVITDVGEILGLWEMPQFYKDISFLKNFWDFANCLNNYWDCFESFIGLITYEADNKEKSAQDDIKLGESILLTGKGDVQITLVWDNYGDIDLHCIDPAGFHIYYASMYSPYTGGYLDYDNIEGYGPENIYFNSAPAGTYRIYLHYYAEKYGITSVNYIVSILINGSGSIYTGTISGEGSMVEIATIVVETSAPPIKNSNTTIDWINLPKKSNK